MLGVKFVQIGFVPTVSDVLYTKKCGLGQRATTRENATRNVSCWTQSFRKTARDNAARNARKQMIEKLHLQSEVHVKERVHDLVSHVQVRVQVQSWSWFGPRCSPCPCQGRTPASETNGYQSGAQGIPSMFTRQSGQSTQCFYVLSSPSMSS